MSAEQRAVVVGVACGLALFAALLLIVFATGQTFGQRCAEYFPKDAEAQRQCVVDLSGRET